MACYLLKKQSVHERVPAPSSEVYKQLSKLAQFPGADENQHWVKIRLEIDSRERPMGRVLGLTHFMKIQIMMGRGLERGVRREEAQSVEEWYRRHQFKKIDLSLYRDELIKNDTRYILILKYLEDFNSKVDQVRSQNLTYTKAMAQEATANNLCTLLASALNEPNLPLKINYLQAAYNFLANNDRNIRTRFGLQQLQKQRKQSKLKRPTTSLTVHRNYAGRPMTAHNTQAKFNRPFSGTITVKSTSPSTRQSTANEQIIKQCLEYHTPSQKMISDLEDYLSHRRTLHPELQVPSSRLKGFKKKQLQLQAEQEEPQRVKNRTFTLLKDEVNFQITENKYDNIVVEEQQNPQVEHKVKIDLWPLKDPEEERQPAPFYLQTKYKAFKANPNSQSKPLQTSFKKLIPKQIQDRFLISFKQRFSKHKARNQKQQVRRIESAKIKIQRDNFKLQSLDVQRDEDQDVDLVKTQNFDFRAPASFSTDNKKLQNLESSVQKSQLKRVISANITNIGTFENLVEKKTVPHDCLSVSTPQIPKPLSRILLENPYQKQRGLQIQELVQVKNALTRAQKQFQIEHLRNALLYPEQPKGLQFKGLPNHEYTMISLPFKKSKKSRKKKGKKKA